MVIIHSIFIRKKKRKNKKKIMQRTGSVFTPFEAAEINKNMQSEAAKRRLASGQTFADVSQRIKKSRGAPIITFDDETFRIMGEFEGIREGPEMEKYIADKRAETQVEEEAKSAANVIRNVEIETGERSTPQVVSYVVYGMNPEGPALQKKPSSLFAQNAEEFQEKMDKLSTAVGFAEPLPKESFDPYIHSGTLLGDDSHRILEEALSKLPPYGEEPWMEYAGVPATGAEKDVWIPMMDKVMSSDEERLVDNCFELYIHGKPDDHNVFIQKNQEATYRQLQLDRVLGAGTFGIVSLVRDVTFRGTEYAGNPSEIALKISYDTSGVLPKWRDEVRFTDDPTELRARIFHGSSTKEYVIGVFLNHMFLTPKAVQETIGSPETHVPIPMINTPNVTRTLFGFVCKTLPPPEGQWNDLYTKNLELSNRGRAKRWNKSTRLPEGANPDKIVVTYTGMEYSDQGSLHDASEASDKLTVFPIFIKSYLFQGLFTLGAFRNYGFIHQDIKTDNVGLMEAPNDTAYLYAIDLRPEGRETPMYFYIDPFRLTSHQNKRLLLKFLDVGNYSLSNVRGSAEPKAAIHVMRGTAAYAAPELLLNPRIAGFKRIGNLKDSIIHDVDPPYKQVPYLRQILTKEHWFAPQDSKRFSSEDSILGSFEETETGFRLRNFESSTASDMWSFGLTLIAIMFKDGSDVFMPKSNTPLNNDQRRMSALFNNVLDMINYNAVPKRDWWSFVRRMVGSGTLARFLYGITSMIGFPWNDPVTGDLSPELFDKYVLSGNYPFSRIMWAYENTEAFSDAARAGGWTRNPKFGKSVMGSKIASTIMRLIISWDPQFRSNPIKLLARTFYTKHKGASFFDDMVVPYDEVQRLFDMHQRGEKKVVVAGWSANEVFRRRHLAVSESKIPHFLKGNAIPWKFGSVPKHLASLLHDNDVLQSAIGVPIDEHIIEEVKEEEEEAKPLTIVNPIAKFI
jgi:serine/threonine protein kinase